MLFLLQVRSDTVTGSTGLGLASEQPGVGGRQGEDMGFLC
jgi:hypothetical protein